MNYRDVIQDHFVPSEKDDALDWLGSILMFWPLLPMTLAKGRHWTVKLGAMVAYPLLFAVNLPFLLVLLVPTIMALAIRDMWRDLQ